MGLLYVSSLHIRNFRGIADTRISFHPRITVLVGANNAGKSTIVDALYSILAHQTNNPRVDIHDVRVTAPHSDIRTAPPVELTVLIEPTSGSSFQAGELGRLTPSVSASGEEWIAFKLTCRWNNDPAVRALSATLVRVDATGAEIGEPFSGFPLSALRLRRFGTIREFARGTAGSSTDWSQLFGDLDPGAAHLDAAARDIARAGRRLLRAAPELRNLADEFRGTVEMAGLGPAARLEFNITSLEPEEILRGLEPELTVPNGPRGFPPVRHGLGTQGVLLFRAYELFLNRILQVGQGGYVSPVLTVEEPEAHLHPTAQRAMIDRLASLPGQVVVTTHSPEVVRQLTTENVRVLRSTANGALCVQGGGDSRALHDHAIACFARCLVIVEGVGEKSTVECCAKHLNMDLGRLGVQVIDANGQGGIAGLWETFGPYGYQIPVVVVADADRPAYLTSFLARAHAFGAIPAVPTGRSQMRLALNRLDYFTPRWGENLECALARTDAAIVDGWFISNGGLAHDDWVSRQSQPLKTAWGTVLPKILSPVKARACRIAKEKYQAPLEISALICASHPGTDAVPPYIRSALLRAGRLARSAA